MVKRVDRTGRPDVIGDNRWGMTGAKHAGKRGAFVSGGGMFSRRNKRDIHKRGIHEKAKFPLFFAQFFSQNFSHVPFTHFSDTFFHSCVLPKWFSYCSLSTA